MADNNNTQASRRRGSDKPTVKFQEHLLKKPALAQYNLIGQVGEKVKIPEFLVDKMKKTGHI